MSDEAEVGLQDSPSSESDEDELVINEAEEHQESEENEAKDELDEAKAVKSGSEDDAVSTGTDQNKSANVKEDGDNFDSDETKNAQDSHDKDQMSDDLLTDLKSHPEESEENIDDHEDDDLKRSKTTGGFTGRGVTLQMLLADQILTPKENSMTLEYMGQKFVGDLLADGRIRSSEMQEVFSSPSAWALRCKKIVNPEQKYGCGWSSVSSKRSIFDVRYCGRPLDVYKNQWMRKRRIEQSSESLPNDSNGQMSSVDQTIANESCFKLTPTNRTVVKHETLGNRAVVEDPNVLVELMNFAIGGKLQPFLLSVHTSALIVMDVHCSLTSSEVVGYLGGIWDTNNNTLIVKRSYPCLSRLADAKRGLMCELAIAQELERDGLSLIGWYHSHPLAPATPTVLDIDAQLDYQLKLKGAGELGYRPCIGVICSPYYREPDDTSESTYPLNCFWVLPPPESRPQEVARPMAMQHNVVVDGAIEEEIVAKIEACVKFYKDLPDKISFDDHWTEKMTFLDKLKALLTSKLRNENDIVIVDLLDELLSNKPTKVSAKKLKMDLEAEPVNDSAVSAESVVTASTQTGVSCM